VSKSYRITTSFPRLGKTRTAGNSPSLINWVGVVRVTMSSVTKSDVDPMRLLTSLSLSGVGYGRSSELPYPIPQGELND